MNWNDDYMVSIECADLYWASQENVKELADALKRVINATQCNPRRPDIAAAVDLLKRYES